MSTNKTPIATGEDTSQTPVRSTFSRLSFRAPGIRRFFNRHRFTSSGDTQPGDDTKQGGLGFPPEASSASRLSVSNAVSRDTKTPAGNHSSETKSIGPFTPVPLTRRLPRDSNSLPVACSDSLYRGADFPIIDRGNDTPPVHIPSANPPLSNQTAFSTAPTEEDPYAFLSDFDTVLLIDDSSSMSSLWHETSLALRQIAPVCAAHDADGVDILFMNKRPRNPTEYCGLKTARDIERIFNKVTPRGLTPTGRCLDDIIRLHLSRYAKNPKGTKPLNIIVITDGVPTDNVEEVIVSAARKLDELDAPAWQIGVQFFQVGDEPGAAEALKKLDDGLSKRESVRDMVDTVPFSGGGLTSDGILKVVLGAVNRRLDRKQTGAKS
ncbi:MAG: hypothetical protein M1839_004566 [Geoglossum umbratile]|nr:MAG: hypothetical protein M1839_004566 [Geoglossum umbratile]